VLDLKSRAHDGFFDLGGDSMLARLGRNCGLPVTPCDVFVHRSAIALADFYHEESSDDDFLDDPDGAHQVVVNDEG
jgi:hypothetical protein